MAYVFVHSCFDPEKESRPVMCGCQRNVSWRTAERMAGLGEVKFLEYKAGNGKMYPDKRNVVLLGKIDRPPVATTISMRNIQRAYVDDQHYQQIRIQIYGQITQQAFANLGAELREAQSAPGMSRRSPRHAQRHPHRRNS